MAIRRTHKGALIVAAAGSLALVVSGFSSPASSTPATQFAHPWMNTNQSPSQRAAELLAVMTQSEKIDVAAQRPANPSLGIPGLRVDDGPDGLRGMSGVTAYPSAENLAASFDPALAAKYGAALGQEAWGKHIGRVFAPVVNITRNAYWGREAETFGEDPYLSGQTAASEIRGIQDQHVIATVKHYAGNNQENDRFGHPTGNGVNDLVSERALQEIYYPAFKAAITQGHAQSVMCAINRVNGVKACQSPELMNALEHTWGFKGFIIPDTLAVSDPVAAFNVGQVLGISADQLTQGIASRAISEQTLNAGVRRILTAAFATGQFDVANTGSSTANVATAAHRAVATEVSERGSVLLENRQRILPLSSKISSLAVIGEPATPTASQLEQGGSAYVTTTNISTPLDAITARAGAGTTINHAEGSLGDVPLPDIPSSVLTPAFSTGSGLTGTYYSGGDLTGNSQTEVDSTVDLNTSCHSIPGAGCAGSMRWTGTITPPETGNYRFSVLQAGGAKLFINGTPAIQGANGTYANSEDDPAFGAQGAPTAEQALVHLVANTPVSIELDYQGGGIVQLGWEPPSQIDPMIQAAASAAGESKAAVVFVNQNSSEGVDRSNLTLPGDQNQLISAVAAANPNTIVVLNTAGPVVMPWRSEVKGVIEAWLPGQQDGTAIASLLFGDVNFSGHTPVTWPASVKQGPGQTAHQYPGTDDNALYKEGIFVGYRYYQQHHQTPLYPFGYGRSYSTFSIHGVKLARTAEGWAVTATVKNTSKTAGSAVVQAYVRDPRSTGEPLEQLKAFGRVTVNPGATKVLHLVIAPSALSHFAHGKWVTTHGKYEISLGTSVNDLIPHSFVIQR